MSNQSPSKDESKDADTQSEKISSTYLSKLPSNIIILNSYAISALFTVIRNKNTINTDYVFACDRLCRILAEEGLGYLASLNKKITIQTPCGPWTGPKPINPSNICAVSIVRSGDILMEAVRAISPGCSVGKILMQRDESSKDKNAKHYYTKLPKNINKMQVILCDPMLATGGSACGTIKILKNKNVNESNILFLNTIAAPEGVNRIYKEFPKVKIISCAVDPKLNQHKFIVPGLGDFGDRYYRTGDNE